MDQIEKHPHWPTVQKVCKTLVKAGFKGWLAGGCVRDSLLGRIPKDFDVVTDAKPDEIEGLFEKTVAVGKAFGVIKVIENQIEVEVATFRQDGVYQDGRHPTSINFSGPEEDAFRRDFTINGLFYDQEKKQVFDFVDGKKDLNHKCIRAIGNPQDRFQEDALRVLRAIRFVSQLGFKIEPKTLTGIKDNLSLLDKVSWERKFEELDRLFLGNDVHEATQLLIDVELGKRLLPEVRWEALKYSVLAPGQKQLFWIDLFNNVPNPLHKKLFQTMKVSQKFQELIKESVLVLSQFPQFDSLDLSEKWILSAKENTPLVLDYFELTEGRKPSLRQFVEEHRTLPEPLVSGKDLLAHGVPEGQMMGQVLKNCFKRQLEGHFKGPQEAINWCLSQVGLDSNPSK